MHPQAIGREARAGEHEPRDIERAAPSPTLTGKGRMYFLEHVLVITPESAEAADAGPAGFDGLYVLYIQVERIP